MPVMKLINPLIILRILSTILLIETISFLISLPVAIIYDESVFPFILSSGITGISFLILRLVTKGTDFNTITNEQIARIESLINNRPKKCLDYKTPLEVASQFVALRG